MQDREDIIYGVKDLTVRQLYDYVTSRAIRVTEIIDENPGEFIASKRRELEELLWNSARGSDNVDLLQLYIDNYPSGKYTEQARNELAKINTTVPSPPPSPSPVPPAVPGAVSGDEEMWHTTSKSDISALENYIKTYPNGKYWLEARQQINKLTEIERAPKGPEWLLDTLKHASSQPGVQTQIIQEAIRGMRLTVDELIGMIKTDHNVFSLDVVKQLYSSGYLTRNELGLTGIEPQFINIVDGTDVGTNHAIVDVSKLKNPESIQFESQEVYFWGIPSSGKTCALGAILSAANSGKAAKSLQKIPGCGGYDYMTMLSNVFKPGKVSKLPTRTNEDFVSDMSFLLQDSSDRHHALTLIDLSGEMLHAMYMMNAGMGDNLTVDQQKGYKTMRNLLVDNMSRNPKIHFFVLEYGGHENLHKGINQDTMLQGALSHITRLGILKNTDAIYLIVTKADKALKEDGDFIDNIGRYIRTHYSSFYESLLTSTRGINGGKIEIFPFTVGDVCFQNLCKFDPKAAQEVVKLLIERTPGKRIDKIGRLTERLGG